MTENPYSGRRPYEGRNDPGDAEQLPGERPLDDDERAQQAPGEPENPSGQSTRAAHGGQMSADQTGEGASRA